MLDTVDDMEVVDDALEVEEVVLKLTDEVLELVDSVLELVVDVLALVEVVLVLVPVVVRGTPTTQMAPRLMLMSTMGSNSRSISIPQHQRLLPARAIQP